MERIFVVSPPFKGLLAPIPDVKEVIANTMWRELRNLYPGIFIEVGSDYIPEAHKAYDQASLVFALFRDPEPEEIKKYPNSLWLISYTTKERLAYYQTQGVNVYDTFHIKYSHLGMSEEHTLVTVKAGR